MSKPDNPQAFPCAAGGIWIEGMTLLDYFAGQALEGLLAGGNETNWKDTGRVRYAYGVAEAMLAERQKRME